MKTTRIVLAALLCLSSVAAAETAPRLKVYISVDMEGIGGVVTWGKQASPKGADYGVYRKLMTQEVNAAVAGAFDAGATEVLISDSHWDAQNLDLELLDKRVRVDRVRLHGRDDAPSRGSRRLIREGARRWIERRGELKPYKLGPSRWR